MSRTLYWIQCGACGGDSMSLLGASDPDLTEFQQFLDLEVLWHPSLSSGGGQRHRALLEDLMNGQRPLDILCVEGAIIRGPQGTGMFDTLFGKPKKDFVAALCGRAKHVVAIGTCASFGGIPRTGGVGACGLQFQKEQFGGFLGHTFVSASGAPVINLPGCPLSPKVLTAALLAILDGPAPALTQYNTPLQWYGMLVHQGCTRNEYHEFRVEEHDFGAPGCMFFHLGCLGPLTFGPCNKLPWAGCTSRTRAGIPCVGCKRPDFPRPQPFFKTRELEGVPLDLPVGVDRAHFLAYKTMAEAAAPERLKKRKTRI